MNKYLAYFLIFICMFMIIVLCIHLGMLIDGEIRGDTCEKGNIVLNQP